jgi:hypothetical protein
LFPWTGLLDSGIILPRLNLVPGLTITIATQLYVGS